MHWRGWSNIDALVGVERMEELIIQSEVVWLLDPASTDSSLGVSWIGSLNTKSLYWSMSSLLVGPKNGMLLVLCNIRRKNNS
jgi:hypothetical protein